jgi:predicted DCC family thiol-disulfide oxidoreductase YuxK
LDALEIHRRGHQDGVALRLQAVGPATALRRIAQGALDCFEAWQNVACGAVRAGYLHHMKNSEALYNDTCPVCWYEIDAYARRSELDGLPIRFDRLQHAAGWGLTPDQASPELHVRQGGVVLLGLIAFRALWAAMPRWRCLARVTGWPVVRPVSAAFYDWVLAPELYRMHLRRQRRGG